MGNWIVLGGLLVLVFFSARAWWKRKKSGGCGCGCGCAGCTETCRTKEKTKENA